MPSRRHKAAMLSSPRSPNTTIRIFSSADYCLRVLRRISRTALSAGSFLVIDFCLIFVPFGHYDEPEILRYAITSICPKGVDVRQSSEAGCFNRCRPILLSHDRPGYGRDAYDLRSENVLGIEEERLHRLPSAKLDRKTPIMRKRVIENFLYYFMLESSTGHETSHDA